MSYSPWRNIVSDQQLLNSSASWKNLRHSQQITTCLSINNYHSTLGFRLMARRYVPCALFVYIFFCDGVVRMNICSTLIILTTSWSPSTLIVFDQSFVHFSEPGHGDHWSPSFSAEHRVAADQHLKLDFWTTRNAQTAGKYIFRKRCDSRQRFLGKTLIFRLTFFHLFLV